MSVDLTQAIQRWKWFTTLELEQKLERFDLDRGDRNQIEYTLMQRRKSYYNAPVHLQGSDGSSLTIKAAGTSSPSFSAARAARFDWDRMIDAENAYIDEIMAKPIPQLPHAEVNALVSNSAMSMIRRVVPDLIAADICGVQPISASHNWFNVRPESAKPDIEKKSFCLSNAADDNLTSLLHAWAKNCDEINHGLGYYTRSGQTLGRAHRNTVDSEVKIIDYMGWLHPQPDVVEVETPAPVIPWVDQYLFSQYSSADTFKGAKLKKSEFVVDRDVEFMYQTPIKLFEPQRMVYADVGNDDIRHYYPSEAPASTLNLDTSASDLWASIRDEIKTSGFTTVKAVAPMHPPTELFMGSCSSGIYPPAYKAIRKKEVDFTVSVTRPEAEPQKSTLAFNADDEIQAIMEGITFNLRRKEDDEFAQTVSVTMDKLRVNSLGGISFEHYNSWAKQEADEPLSFVLPTPEKDEL